MRIIAKNIATVRAVDGFVAHQCNCTTQGKAAGVAALIFREFEYSDIYKKRKKPDDPGLARLKRPYPAMPGYPTVINLMAQYYPGEPNLIDDAAQKRLQWLDEALFDMSFQIGPGAHKIFIPYKMGCRLGGGNWGAVSEVLSKAEKAYGIEFICCVK